MVPELSDVPASYLGALEWMRDRSHDAEFWIGDVGFWTSPLQEAPMVWEALARRRWPGMHPDFVPFAVDGFGNMFCFHRASVPMGAGQLPVVYWQYETYTAVPVSGSFDHFLAWIWLTASVSARRGVDPLIDHDHLTTVIEPLFDALGRAVPSPLSDGYGTDLWALHRALIAADPRAAGSLLVSALDDLDASHDLRIIERCRMAREAFPQFTAAYLAEADLLEAFGDDGETADLLLTAMKLPLVFSGDPEMAFYYQVPSVNPTEIAERLVAMPHVHEISVEEPIWDIVMRMDPRGPASWLEVAVDYANSGSLTTAVSAATNALWLGVAVPEGVDALILLDELYEALGHSWHRNLVQADMRRLEATLNRDT